MKHIYTSLFVLSTLGLVGVAACGGDESADPSPAVDEAAGGESGEGGSGGNIPQNGDVDAPSVVTTTPEDGAVGVARDQLVVIEFDEPMDTASVEDAYASEALPADTVSFAWNAAKTELTITPDDELAYAEGDPSVAALAYDITIGDTAMDVAGNRLAAPATATFETLRRVIHELPAVPELSGYVMGGSISFSGPIMVGDQEILNHVNELRGFMTFDLTDVPDDTDFESVTIRAAQLTVKGDPSDGLGALHIESVFYEALDQAAFDFAPDASAGELTAGGDEIPVWSAGVSSLVLDDLANREARENLTQYRLRFLDGPDADDVSDQLHLSAEGTMLEIVYLAE